MVALLCMVGLMLLVRDQQAVYQQVGFTRVSTDLKYSFVTGLVYLVYSNGLAAMYCFVVALTSASNVVGTRRSNKPGAWVVFILDQGLAYVLLSAASAAVEVAYLAENGDETTGWDAQCSTYWHFCHLLKASIVVSFLSVILLAIISVLSAKQLFKQYARIKLVGKKGVPEALT